MTDAKRITISIPHELSQRLEAVKGNFNVSAVCTEAMQQEVSRQEFRAKKVVQRPIEKQEFKLNKEHKALLKGKSESEQNFMIDQWRRYWEWEHSFEGIAYSLDGQGVTDALLAQIVFTLQRLPEEVREFVYQKCRFSNICNTATYRTPEDVEHFPWKIQLVETDLSEDYQSVIARTIADAYLDHRFPDSGFGFEIEKAFELEKEACALVKKWGFVGSGAEVSQDIARWAKDAKARRSRLRKKVAK